MLRTTVLEKKGTEEASPVQSTTGELDFDQLYKQYGRNVYYKCLSFLKNETLAKDATQEVFIKVFLKQSKYRQASSLSTWIFSIARNHCIDFLRKQQTRGIDLNYDQEAAAHVPDGATDVVALDERIEELHEVLQVLPAKAKNILLLKFQEQLSIKEIASSLNKSESAVKMSIKRAKEKARKIRREYRYSLN